MILRPLRFEDVTAAAQLFAESAPGAIDPIGAQLPFLQVAERYGISLRHSRLMELAGRPVGVVLNAAQPDCNELFTVHWAVTLSLEGHGLGLRSAARLVVEFAQQGFHAGLAEVHERNLAARRLCHWLGYEPVGTLQHWEGVLPPPADPLAMRARPIRREEFLQRGGAAAELAHWRRRAGLLPRQLTHAACYLLGEGEQLIGGWAITRGIQSDLIETLFWCGPQDMSAILDAAAVTSAGRTVRISNVKQDSPLAVALQQRGLRVTGRWLELRVDLEEVRRRRGVARRRDSLGLL